MKVYLLYKNSYDGCDSWDTVECIYTNKDKAEAFIAELQERLAKALIIQNEVNIIIHSFNEKMKNLSWKGQDLEKRNEFVKQKVLEINSLLDKFSAQEQLDYNNFEYNSEFVIVEVELID